MKAENYLRSDILDIVFENRNKVYGAYELRRYYNGRLLKALLGMAGVLCVMVVFARLTTKSDNSKPDIEVEDFVLSNAKPPEPKIIPPAPRKEVSAASSAPVNQVKHSIPKITPDKDVTPDDKIETISDEQEIGDKTIHSDNTSKVGDDKKKISDEIIGLPEEKETEKDQPFVKAEIEAEFPGGAAAWKQFLLRNLRAGVGTDNNAPAGQYQVFVRFTVSTDGSLSDIELLSDPGFGMGEEAVRVIKKAKWNAGRQNGVAVRSVKTQGITFPIDEQ